MLPALTIARRSPLLALVLFRPARAGTGTVGVDDAVRTGDRMLVRIVLGVAAAWLLVRVLLVPLALVAAAALVLAGGISLVAGVSGLG